MGRPVPTHLTVPPVFFFFSPPVFCVTYLNNNSVATNHISLNSVTHASKLIKLEEEIVVHTPRQTGHRSYILGCRPRTGLSYIHPHSHPQGTPPTSLIHQRSWTTLGITMWPWRPLVSVLTGQCPTTAPTSPGSYRVNDYKPVCETRSQSPSSQGSLGAPWGS